MTNTPFDELVAQDDQGDRFKDFWRRVPKGAKKARADAEKAYWAARKDTPHEVICEGWERYLEHKPDWQAYCYPATFIRRKRWQDEYEDKASVADEQTIRERPQYLRQDNTPPELTEEEKEKRKLRAEILEEMRREGLEPYELPDLPDQIRRRMSARTRSA